MQQSQDPFAAYGQAPAPQQQAADPWAAMAAPTPPAQAPTTTPPADVTPPPAVVVADASNQNPPSPMGDVSVLAASGAAAGTAPAVPNPTQPGIVQQLQPAFAPVPTQQQQAPQSQAPPVAPANPFDFGAVADAMPAAPAPSGLPPQAPPTPPQAEQPIQQVQQQQQMVSPPISPVPASFAPQGNDPFGYAFSPMVSPVTSPNGSPGNSGAMVPSAAPNADPYGVQQQAPPPVPNMGGAQPQQAVVPSAVPNADPFGVFGGGQPAPAADPFGSGALVTSAPPPAAGGAVVDDPFGIFGTPTPPPAAQAPPAQAPAPVVQEEDPWAAAGFSQQVSNSQPHAAQAPASSSSNQYNGVTNNLAAMDNEKPEDKPITLDSNGLPSEGEYYEARINARSLGAMFYTANNLEDTLFAKIPGNIISALGKRPVVAYVADNSAAYNSGIHSGHVVLTINGNEPSDPEHCASLIRNSPRPMTLRCYIPPELTLSIPEGKHFVKYDSKDLEAPASGQEWKKKYVVVGGIVTKPWMMNMFYTKKDYDIAVKEAHAGRKISVKVKQFDLRGARIILKGRDGKPNWIDYRSERKPWYYITILPAKGYPIKISSESLDELEPVYSAVRRFVRKDMEARYQYRMQESGLGGGGNGSRNGSRRRHSSGRNDSGFSQFDDAPRPDSYWR